MFENIMKGDYVLFKDYHNEGFIRKEVTALVLDGRFFEVDGVCGFFDKETGLNNIITNSFCINYSQAIIDQIKENQIETYYRHFKGTLYQFILEGINANTKEEYICYREYGKNKNYFRLKKEFFEDVKTTLGETKKRFLLEDSPIEVFIDKMKSGLKIFFSNSKFVFKEINSCLENEIIFQTKKFVKYWISTAKNLELKKSKHNKIEDKNTEIIFYIIDKNTKKLNEVKLCLRFIENHLDYEITINNLER